MSHDDLYRTRYMFTRKSWIDDVFMTSLSPWRAISRYNMLKPADTYTNSWNKIEMKVEVDTPSSWRKVCPLRSPRSTHKHDFREVETYSATEM
ncbi:hypothetical protein CONPUDRAFT_83979 [Coniophora puteana RWD-64-598 SS2]|uniref:Uncharacterized protein n=1 Tax=Coniophora puteana (strain RWD-64-598) TaxID=741705 RepID=A0A5M3MHU4_CONPW|nr:uncharacterized protein CONPUDRAFT_83979 [Coniophora puteana RWD-64-598 SS2]EIW78673.1 hypothetical protein CONPUDRAFT_83979 [Coniophora puteana RWD-64-598 SS2]